jgi:hypothetical protein
VPSILSVERIWVAMVVGIIAGGPQFYLDARIRREHLSWQF